MDRFSIAPLHILTYRVTVHKIEGFTHSTNINNNVHTSDSEQRDFCFVQPSCKYVVNGCNLFLAQIIDNRLLLFLLFDAIVLNILVITNYYYLLFILLFVFHFIQICSACTMYTVHVVRPCGLQCNTMLTISFSFLILYSIKR